MPYLAHPIGYTVHTFASLPMRMSRTPVGTKTRGWWGVILGLGHGPRTVHARRPGHRPPPHTDRSPQRRRARYPGAAHVPGRRPDTPHHHAMHCACMRHHGVCSVYPGGTPAAALISSRPHPACVCVRELWAVRGLMRLVNPGGGQLAKATPPYTLPILFGRSIISCECLAASWRARYYGAIFFPPQLLL
jgi:hypothetical protein